MVAARAPQRYSKAIETKYFKKELSQSVQSTDVVAGVIGGGLFLFKNLIAFCKAEINASELAGNVIIDTGKADIRGDRC